jgi:hypothetical protein
MQKASFGFKLIEGHKGSRDHEQAPVVKFVQAGLFPYSQNRSVIFVFIPGITEQEFVSLVRVAQPAFAVELRRVPRFDIGRLTRQSVFKWFENANCKYIDPIPKREADSDDLKRWIGPTLDLFRENSQRPIMFFLSTTQNIRELRQAVCDALGCAGGEWTIFEVPDLDASIQKRSIAR